MIHEEVKVSHSLQKAVKIHNSPYFLAARLTELKYTLKYIDEWCKIAFDSTREKSRQVDEYLKTFFQATEALKDLRDEVVDLRRALHDSLSKLCGTCLK